MKIRTAAIDAGTIDSHRATSYVARRYTRIVAGATPPAPPKPSGRDAPTVAYDRGDGRDDIVMAYQHADNTFSYYVWRNGNYAARVWYTSGPFSLSRVAGRLVLGNW